MKNEPVTRSHKALLSCLVASLALLAGSVQAELDDLVIISGKTSESSSLFVGQGNDARGISIEEICQRTIRFLVKNGLLIVGAGYAGGPGVDALTFLYGKDIISSDPAGVLLHLANCAEAKPPREYAVIFTECSMLTMDGTNMMWWTVPPGPGGAQMVFADASTREVIEDLSLDAVTKALSENARVRKVDASFSPGGGSREFELTIERGVPGAMVKTQEVYDASRYTFNYESKITPLEGAGVQMVLGTVNTHGTAYIATGVPGADVMSAFYSNFSNHIAASPSMFTQTIDQWAEMVAIGVPLQVDLTVRARAMMVGPATTSSTSIGTVSIDESGASREQLCGRIAIPEGWNVTDVQEMMAGASGGPDAEEMNEAMSAMQEAMQSVTPEQRAAMEALGITIPGMPASKPAESPPPKPAAQTSDSSMSDALTTDNLTESVQNHLSFLGYDTNTNGEMSLDTTIAISQFQAEKGMEVTGEVSPVLLGALAAEVDR